MFYCETQNQLSFIVWYCLLSAGLRGGFTSSPTDWRSPLLSWCGSRWVQMFPRLCCVSSCSSSVWQGDVEQTHLELLMFVLCCLSVSVFRLQCDWLFFCVPPQALDLLLDKMKRAGFDFSRVSALSGSGQVRHEHLNTTCSTNTVKKTCSNSTKIEWKVNGVWCKDPLL